jgi:hypothetical protein
VRSKRETSAFNRNNYKKNKERKYYRKNDYKSSININRTNKLTNPLPNSKRNRIIVRLSPYNYRDSHVRRSRNVESTQTPPIIKNRYRSVRHESGIENIKIQIKSTYK